MKREKIEERLPFSDKDRQKISGKSRGKCCHCGVKLGKRATIDHFVPLSQGGTNRDINLIALCKKCNTDKDNKIFPPEYLKYLGKDERSKIEDYFDSYVRSFEFFDRRNILACDRYFVQMNVPVLNWKKKGGAPFYTVTSINRATSADMGKIYEYYIKYLKKYDELDSEVTARQNLEFWFRFGCLYYAEIQGEIKVLCAITFTNVENATNMSEDYRLTILMMPYYNTERVSCLAYSMATSIPRHVCMEQNIIGIPVTMQVVHKDNFASVFAKWTNVNITHTGNFQEIYYLISRPDVPRKNGLGDQIFEETKALVKKKLKLNEEKMNEYLEEHPDISWMRNYIIIEDKKEKENEKI